MDRDAFLGRVAGATMSGEIPSWSPPTGPLPDYDTDNLQARFRERAQQVNSVVHGAVSRHGVPRAVTAIAAGHDARTFVAWDELAGVPSALTAEGLERLDHFTPPEAHKTHNVSYMPLDLGVTSADAGLAESGSVVMSHGPGRPRMASAIPEIHVVILEVGAIFPTLAHWAERQPGRPTDTANLVIVTGPSRTGDIENQINLGVHGPRHVHIVMVK